MKIHFLNRDGVPPAEVQIHAEIEAHFSKYEFSQNWMGFASFALPDRQFGEIDFDLVLFTHRDIICVELKNWHGQELKSNGGHWLVDGKDRGSSPLTRTNGNKRKLATFLKTKGGFYPPIIEGLVVLHGNITQINLSNEERRRVLTKEEFFSLHDPKYYDSVFNNSNYRPLSTDYTDYLTFFYDGNVCERIQKFAEYEREPGNLFEHKDGLYKEFLAKKPNTKHKALIRYWNFDKHPKLHEDEARKGVALREKNLFEYLEQQNPVLCQNLLRPITEANLDHIGLDYSEILVLRANSSRLTEFLNQRLKNLSFDERLDFSQILLHKAAQFHQQQISHHNLVPRNIWINDGAEVQLTGFSQSHFPGNEARNYAGINTIKYPEQEPCESESSNDFHKDIYALGCIIFEVLFSKKTQLDSTKPFSSLEIPEEHRSKFDNFFQRALNSNPQYRYQTAEEMLNAFLELRQTSNENDLYNEEDFKAFFDNIIDTRNYQEIEELCSSKDLYRYRGVDEYKHEIIVSEWSLPARVNRLNDAERAILLNSLRRLNLIQSSNLENVSKILNFGFDRSQRSLIVVEESVSNKTNIEVFKNSEKPVDELKKFSLELINLVQRFWLIGHSIGCITIKNIFLENGKPFLQISPQQFYFNLEEDEPYSMGFEDDVRNLTDILFQIFSTSVHKSEASPIANSLKRLLDADAFQSLDPLLKILDIPKPRSIEFQKYVPELGSLYLSTNPWRYDYGCSGRLDPLENGSYLLRITPSKNKHNCCFVYIVGRQYAKEKQISFSISVDDDNYEANSAYVNVLQEKTKEGAFEFKGEVFIDAEYEDDNAIEVLKTNEFVWGHILAAIEATNAGDWSIKRYLDPKLNIEAGYIPTNQLWKEILKAEEDSLPQYTIEKANFNVKTNYWELELNANFDISQEDDDDNIFIEYRNGDVWKKCGIVDRDVSNQGNIISVVAFRNYIFEKGIVIRIRTMFEKSSFDRRRQALDEVLNGNCRIPNFSQYFDQDQKISPQSFSLKPVDLRIASDNHFNEDQTAAFQKVLSTGPISLLQGPPGTGKTRFISALMLYLIKENPNVRILLTSQSNEAVNNAIEKMIDQCRREEFDLSVVRIGQIDKVSTAVQWYHAKNQESRYREKLRVEKFDRILRISNTLGLPKDFSKDIFHVYSALWGLAHNLKISIKKKDPETERVQRQYYLLVERLFGISIEQKELTVSDPFEVIDFCIKYFMDKHYVDNQRAVQKLRQLIELTFEFEKNLGTPDSKFAEFLTKTKTIVAGTLVGLGGRALGLKENTFDWVIVDEASRATASELAIVCQVGRHVLLVGDHKQLPPSYSTELQNQLRKNLKIKGNINKYLISDFERIFESSYGKEIGRSLLIQYRMDPVIGKMVSSCFYDNKLQTGRASRASLFTNMLPASLRDSPIVWYDTSISKSHGKETAPKGRSIYNLDEATAIVRLLTEIFSNSKFIDEMCKPNLTEPPVGVICMYSGQKDRILNFVRQNSALLPYLEWIKVDTVDSYQGKENQIIILSTVRQNNSQTTGFLKADSRVNVAVSRAKDSLIIFGSVNLWSSLPHMSLGKVLRYLQNEGCTPKDFTELLKQDK